MSFFDKEDNVEKYIEMTKGYNPEWFVGCFSKYISDDAKVLELGMGPGNDFDLLRKLYNATGSDNSEIFISRYKNKYPDADVVVLDAVTLNVDRKFDAVYSNKVLHHLTKENFKKSLARQLEVVNEGGILFHSFWYGDKEEMMENLRFVYYTEETIKDFLPEGTDLLAIELYMEEEENDSFYLVLKKKES